MRPPALALVDQPMVERAADRLLPLADLPGTKGPAFVRGAPTPGTVGGRRPPFGGRDSRSPTASAARQPWRPRTRPSSSSAHRGEERNLDLQAIRRGGLVAFGGDTLCIRRQWLKARQAVVGAETSQEQLVARLCLCLAELNLGRPVEALKALEPLAGSLFGRSRCPAR